MGTSLAAVTRLAICSGVVPQHPPTTVAPISHALSIRSANSSGERSYTVLPSIICGSPALGLRMMGIDAHSTSLGKRLIIFLGPTEQFIPIASTPSPSSILTTASGSAPVRSLPSAPKAQVTNIGNDEFSFAASTAAFVSYRSLIVSISMRSAPNFSASRIFVANISTASSKSRSPNGLSILPVGPTSKAIYSSLPERLTASLAISRARESSPSTLSHFSLFIPNVFVFIISAPAFKYARCNATTSSLAREFITSVGSPGKSPFFCNTVPVPPSKNRRSVFILSVIFFILLSTPLYILDRNQGVNTFFRHHQATLCELYSKRLISCSQS